MLMLGYTEIYTLHGNSGHLFSSFVLLVDACVGLVTARYHQSYTRVN